MGGAGGPVLPITREVLKEPWIPDWEMGKGPGRREGVVGL